MTLQNTIEQTVFTTAILGEAGQVLHSPISAIHETALDLYGRGLNVFPLPSPWEWRAAALGTNSHKKPPYAVKPLYTSRMLLNADWLFLFDRANLGLMLGRTSGNALAIDCDSEPAYYRMGKELLTRGLNYWALKSHRGGSFLLRLTDGEASNLPQVAGWPDVQIWGNAHYMVLPPSIHPSGEFYQWVTPDPRSLAGRDTLPAVNLSALAWLGVELLKTRGNWQPPELYDLPEWAALLSQGNRAILATGAKQNARNSELTKAVYDLAGNAIPYGDAEPIFLRAAARCVPPYPEREALDMLKSAYRKKGAKPARKSGGVRVDILQAEAAVASFNWRGVFVRVTNKRRALFLACIERAKHEPGEVWRASIRELSELSGQAVNGVRVGLAELQKANLIKFVSVSDTGAHLYKFGNATKVDSGFKPLMPLPRGGKLEALGVGNFDADSADSASADDDDSADSELTVGDTLIPPCSISVSPTVTQKTDIPATHAEQNLFNRLGLNAWYVWRFVCYSPADKATIARALNIPRTSVTDSLKRLTADNVRLVVLNDADGLYYGEPKTEYDLQALCVALGIADRAQTRKEAYQTERARRVNWELWRARNAWARKYGPSR